MSDCIHFDGVWRIFQCPCGCDAIVNRCKIHNRCVPSTVHAERLKESGRIERINPAICSRCDDIEPRMTAGSG